MYDVIIIGGGIAGLSASVKLNQNNVKSCLLVEARDRLGGRMMTSAQSGLDLGAQWIHGGVHANSLYNYAIKKGLLKEEKQIKDGWDGEIFYTSQGRVTNPESSKKAWEIYERIYNEAENYFRRDSYSDNYGNSIQTFYNIRSKEELEKLRLEDSSDSDYNFEDMKLILESLVLKFAGYLGDTFEEAGLSTYGTAIELPGGDVVLPKGTGSIIEELHKESGPIRLNEKVSRVEWNKDGVTIFIDKNPEEVLRAKHVICTVPLGVIQNNLITFQPSLGQAKLNALANLRPGRISKIFLHFQEPFWLQGEGELAFAWSKQEMDEGRQKNDWTTSVPGMNEVDGHSDVLCMWVCGEAAQQVDNLQENDILKGASLLLRKFTGDPEISTPNRITRHAWMKDPLCMGTWSYPSLHSKHVDYYELMKPLPSEDNPRLLLAGEHTHPTYWSFMHGARLSGIEQAEKIIKFVEQKQL